MRSPALILALTTGPGGTPVQSDLSGIATRLAEHPAVPGAFVGWTTAGSLDLAVAGTRRQGVATPVEERDLWHIGSLTKSMTATLAARMVAAAAVDWDTTAGAVLGEARPTMSERWRDVTLKEFLRHASGMRANPRRIGTRRLGQGTRLDYVARMLESTPAGSRGGFFYSNAGYVVAGAMLEAAGGAPWEDLVAREVFEPLGLSSAGFGPPEGEQPWGHRLALIGGLRAVPPGPRADNMPALGPAGRVHIAGGDMLRYLRAHLTESEAYLPRKHWRRLHEPHGPGDYAMGWADVDGVLRHSGSNTMWFAQMRLYRKQGVAVFVAVNAAALGRVRAPVEQAADAAFRLVSGRD